MKGAPSEKHLCPVGVQSSGSFSSGASPSHFPVSHHPSSKERACNYPFSTWVPDSQLISEPRLHLSSAAPSPALQGDSPRRPPAQPLYGFTFVLPLPSVIPKLILSKNLFFFLPEKQNVKGACRGDWESGGIRKLVGWYWGPRQRTEGYLGRLAYSQRTTDPKDGMGEKQGKKGSP